MKKQESPAFRRGEGQMQLRQVGRELATAVADREAAEERLLAAEGLAVRPGEDELVPRAPDETGQAVRDRRGGLRFPSPDEQLGMIADCLNRHSLWGDDCSTGAAAVRLIEQGRSAKLTLDNLTVELRTGYGLDERDISRAFRRIGRGDADRQTLHVIVDWLLRNYPSPEADRAATALTEPEVDRTPVATCIMDAIRKAANGLWITTERGEQEHPPPFASGFEDAPSMPWTDGPPAGGKPCLPVPCPVVEPCGDESHDETLVVRGPDQSELYRIPTKQHPSDEPVAWATEVQLRYGMTRLLQALKDRGDRDPKRDVVDQVLALLARGDKAQADDPLPEPEQAADDEDERAGLWMTTERNG